MYTYEKILTTKTLYLFFIFLLIGTINVSAQKKSAAQLSSENEIDNKRSEVNTLKQNISLKKAEINSKQSIFDSKKAAYAAEQQRIEGKDAAVKNRESCLSNLLADILPLFATDVINEYSSFRNGGGGNKKIEEFAFGQTMIEVLTPAYQLAYKDYISTFVDNTDRAAFAAYAEENFDKYYLGGLDRSGDTLDGILSDHFHPKNCSPSHDIAQPLADKYIKTMADLNHTDAKTIRMAKAMPIEFYIGWDKFVNDCGLILVHTMKDKRKKQRVPEVEAQQKLGIELRSDFLELEELKAQRQAMEEELYISGSNLKFLEETYLKKYKRNY